MSLLLVVLLLLSYNITLVTKGVITLCLTTPSGDTASDEVIGAGNREIASMKELPSNRGYSRSVRPSNYIGPSSDS